MSTTTVPLVFTKPPLSLNDRMHWRQKANVVRTVREHAAARANGLPWPDMDAATVTLHYRPRDRRQRDKDNLYATLKPCIDGLVDADPLPDDHGEHVEPRVKLHDPVKGEPGVMWLEVEPR